jgi:hypothetical protein
MRNAYKILVRKYEGKRHLEDLVVDGKIILEWNEDIPQRLATWSENCKWYNSLPLGAVASLFCESV